MRALSEIQKFAHVLIENFLGLRIGQRKAQLVDDLRPHADPFAPAIGTDFFLNQFSLGVAERRLGEFAVDSAAAIAENLPFADGLLRSGGDGERLGTGAPSSFSIVIISFFGIRSPRAAATSTPLVRRSIASGFRFSFSRAVGEQLVDLGDIRDSVR